MNSTADSEWPVLGKSDTQHQPTLVTHQPPTLNAQHQPPKSYKTHNHRYNRNHRYNTPPKAEQSERRPPIQQLQPLQQPQQPASLQSLQQPASPQQQPQPPLPPPPPMWPILSVPIRSVHAAIPRPVPLSPPLQKQMDDGQQPVYYYPPTSAMYLENLRSLLSSPNYPNIKAIGLTPIEGHIVAPLPCRSNTFGLISDIPAKAREAIWASIVDTITKPNSPLNASVIDVSGYENPVMFIFDETSKNYMNHHFYDISTFKECWNSFIMLLSYQYRHTISEQLWPAAVEAGQNMLTIIGTPYPKQIIYVYKN